MDLLFLFQMEKQLQKYNNFSSNYFGISYPYGNSCVTYDPDTKLIVVVKG